MKPRCNVKAPSAKGCQTKGVGAQGSYTNGDEPRGRLGFLRVALKGPLG